LIVAGLVALALIGILALRSGDDDKDAKPNDQGTSVPSEPTAKTRFIEEAEALCAKNSAKMAKLKQPVNPADATIYYARTGEALRKLVKKIKGLDIPSADKPILDKLFKTLDKLVATIDQLTVESVRSGELATQALNRKVGKINIRANALAQEYGLNGCVQG
jgi:hypothetical protein